MIGKLLYPEIESLIRAKDFATLKEELSALLPADIADIMNEIPDHEKAVLFRLLPHELAADAFEYLDFDSQQSMIKALGQSEAAAILNEMSPDDRTAFFEELPGNAVKQLIVLLTPEERKTAQSLLGYPENSVGRLMTPDYIAVRSDWTVQKVLDHVREFGKNSETLSFIYVVDEKGILIDDIQIREFLISPLNKTVGELMNENFASLNVSDDQEKAVNAFKKYDRGALPVTDGRGYLLGIVTADDMLDVAEEEATEDIQKFGGMEALDEPYMSIPLFRMIKKRGTWLIVLFIGEMFTATAMGYFEDEISKAVVLALFVPLIISSGGNSGSQAATLIIRAMAVGEVTLRDWWRVMHREIISGLMLGGILGSIGFIRIAAWSIFSNIYGPHWFLIALTVALSLVGVVLWGTLSGSMLPFVLRRLGVDPATSSAPFVATLVDVTGLIIYFSIAFLVLHGTLL